LCDYGRTHEETEVDVAVIGAGTAGLSAYRAAQAQGARRLIEGGPYGTTCARVGCMPSKLLIAAAEAAHMLDVAPGFGVHAGEKRIDGVAVMERVRASATASSASCSKASTVLAGGGQAARPCALHRPAHAAWSTTTPKSRPRAS
jgi:pyruvate/2-oxoglutarate dehydrogenase complex dihydrolipoamide dehydrogenase (E3) component